MTIECTKEDTSTQLHRLNVNQLINIKMRGGDGVAKWGKKVLTNCTNVHWAFCLHLHKPGCECESWWVKSLVVLLELSRWWPRILKIHDPSNLLQKNGGHRTLGSLQGSGAFSRSISNPVSSFYPRTLCQPMLNNVNLPPVDSNQEEKKIVSKMKRTRNQEKRKAPA